MSLFGLFGPPDVEKLKAKQDVKGLTKALKYDKDWQIRVAATVALSDIGDTNAIESLVICLEDNEFKVREAAAQALEHLAWKPEQNVSGAAYWIAKRQWDKCTEIGEPAAKPLFAVLFDTEPEVQEAATSALLGIGINATRFLVTILEDADWQKRAKAAEVIGEIGDRGAVEPLIASLETVDWKVLVDYGYYMSSKVAVLVSKRAIPSQVHALYAPTVAQYHKELGLRCVVAKSLGQIGDSRAVKPLIAIRDGEGALGVLLAEILNESVKAGTIKGSDVSESFIAEAIEKTINNDLRKAVSTALDMIDIPKDTEPPFERYEGSGNCDVCGNLVGPNEAYLIPVDVFYDSPGYKNWVQNNTMMQPVVQAAGGIEEYLKKQRSMDNTSHSAVCSACVELFQDDPSRIARISFGLAIAKAITDYCT